MTIRATTSKVRTTKTSSADGPKPMGGNSEQCVICKLWVRCTSRDELWSGHIKTEHPEEYQAKYAPVIAEMNQSKAEDELATPRAKKAAKAKVQREAKPKREPRPCGCNCGLTVPKMFAQGHDARLRGRIQRAFAEHLKANEGNKYGFDIFAIDKAEWANQPGFLSTFYKGIFAELTDAALVNDDEPSKTSRKPRAKAS